MNRTAAPFQHHATIQGCEINPSIDFRKQDATVVSLYRQVGMTRHKDFITYRPVIVFLVLRSAREDLISGGLNSNLPSQLFGLARVGRTSLHLCTHQNLVLVPTLHGDAAVLPAVDGNSAARLERLLPHLTVSH